MADAAADAPYLSFKLVEGPQNTAHMAIPLGGGESSFPRRRSAPSSCAACASRLRGPSASRCARPS